MRISKVGYCCVLAISMLVVALFVEADSASTDSAKLKFPKPPYRVTMPNAGISAHRGASDTHPENTLPALREALRLGAHQIEFDVYLSKDGVPVLMHDHTVDRTTDGSGVVFEMTLEQLKKLDAGSWKDPRFAGTRVPTLDEALAIMPPNVWLNVQLRGDREVGRKVAQAIVKHGQLHQAFLACGREVALGAREIEPSIMICNMENQGASAAYVNATLQQRDHFIQIAAGMAAPELIEKLKKRGVMINFCCTNNPDDLKNLYGHGIMFPLTDRVATMLEKAEQLRYPRRPYAQGESYEEVP